MIWAFESRACEILISVRPLNQVNSLSSAVLIGSRTLKAGLLAPELDDADRELERFWGVETDTFMADLKQMNRVHPYYCRLKAGWEGTIFWASAGTLAEKTNCTACFSENCTGSTPHKSFILPVTKLLLEAAVKILLDRRSPDPVYRQIRDRISRLIQSGTLQPGDRLPSIRTLAEAARVNKLTVIEAYGVLEADGLVYARAGSGYFVSTPTHPLIQGTSKFAPRQEVVIPEQGEMSYFDLYMASVQAHHQGEISVFSSGFPYLSDADMLQRIARRALRHVDETLFNYALPQGQEPLRKQIAQLLIQQGLDISPDDLIITSGSMQGLSLVMNYCVQPGDWVIVENPTYHGALAILQNLGARVIGIPMTNEGINLDLLARYLHSHRPRLIYTPGLRVGYLVVIGPDYSRASEPQPAGTKCHADVVGAALSGWG